MSNIRQAIYVSRKKQFMKLPQSKKDVLQCLEDPDFVSPENMIIKTKGEIVLLTFKENFNVISNDNAFFFLEMVLFPTALLIFFKCTPSTKERALAKNS